MSVADRKPHAALLIDWENLKSSVNQQLGALPDIVTLKKAVRRVGTLRVARAYANWSDAWHDGDSHRLSQQGVEPVHVQTKAQDGGQTLKNSVDLKLACDGVEMLIRHSTIETFVIASGDGDLVHLVEKLKSYGKTVVIVAARSSVSHLLQVAADQVIYYDDLVSGLRQVGKNEAVGETLEAFRNAVNSLHSSGRDTSLTMVKAEMVQVLGGFNEEALGIPSFRQLAFLAEAKGFCLVDAKSEPFRAFPVEEQRKGLFDASHWRALVSCLDPEHEYPKKEIQTMLASQRIPEQVRGPLIDAAIAAHMIAQRQRTFVSEGQKRYGGGFRLNPHHPRVQVLKTK